MSTFDRAKSSISQRPIQPGFGIYIHFPFCRKKCHYCDFACIRGNESLYEPYLAALDQEIHFYPHLETASVYLGGGTPSLIPATLLNRLLEQIYGQFAMAPGAEITLEVNPGTGSIEKWSAARESGVNRASIGAQVMDDVQLAHLGRDHCVADVENCVAELRMAGLEDISLDLIFGLPGQTTESWQRTLTNALELKPTHLSAYSLEIPERTVFGRRWSKGQLDLPGPDAEREMLDCLVEVAAGAGYRRYEISSWCLPGFESVHNRLYWLNRPYLGLGTGAHSFYQGRRYSHDRSVQGYIKDPFPKIPNVPQAGAEARTDAMIMGLRLVQDGLSRLDFTRSFGEDPRQFYGERIDRLLALGLIEETPTTFRLTSAALPLANEVFCAFVD